MNKNRNLIWNHINITFKKLKIPPEKKKLNFHAVRLFGQSILLYEIKQFHFQYVSLKASDIILRYYDPDNLTYMLKLFSTFCIMLEYARTKHNLIPLEFLFCVTIVTEMSILFFNKHTNNKINIFIISLLLQNVGLCWLVQLKEKSEYDFNNENSHWIYIGCWYNSTI